MVDENDMTDSSQREKSFQGLRKDTKRSLLVEQVLQLNILSKVNAVWIAKMSVEKKERLED
jgi:hypothetical protein